MLAQTVTRREPFRGVRPMQMSRDLRDLAALIDEAFGDEPDHAGQAVAAELRRLSRWSPLLWLLDRASSGLGDGFTGFVWEEDGHAIGNVTLSREGYGQTRWLISNVVVSAPYRRRGIARQLMEASLEFARLRGGRVAYLLVRRDSEAAMSLYRSLEFSEIGGLVTLVREKPPRERLDEAPLEPGTTLRAPRWEDIRGLNQLSEAATPEPLLRTRPAQAEALPVEVEQGFDEWLLARFGRKRSYRWVLEGGGQILAYLRLERNKGKQHRMRLMVHPSVRGRVESALAARALNLLVGADNFSILADVGANETGALQAMIGDGFTVGRWLVAMMRRLDVGAVREG
jgi:ribosomal protein S18 acetylase RimI-like enzyme